ncbi:MAG: TonB-dependent receptor [Bacteroidia bacterium]
MKFYLILLLSLVLSQTLSAQQLTQTVRGAVVDYNTQQPIPGAIIILDGSNPILGTTSDFDGNFRLEKVPVGRPVIQVSMVGYSPIKLGSLVLTSSKELILNVALEAAFVQGKTVEIIAKVDKDKPLNELSAVSTRTFSVDEAQRYAGSFGDPARLSTSFAGVVAGNDQRNDIVVRGNSPLGVLWRLEGIDIPSPSHYSGSGTSGGAVSILNTNVLANSDFSTGAFAAEYGNATSAAFDVKMRSGNNEKHEFTGQIGFNGFEGGVEGPLSSNKKSSYLVNYRYSTLGAFDAVGLEFVQGGVPKYQDLSFKLDFQHKKGKTSLFGIAGTSDIHFTSEQDSLVWIDQPAKRQDLKNGSDLAVVGINHIQFLSSNTTLKISLAGTGSKFRTSIDSITSIYNAFPTFRSSITESKLLSTIVLNTKLGNRSVIRAGVIASKLFYNTDVRIYSPVLNQDVTLANSNGTGDLIQTYAQWHFKATEKLSLDLGLHALAFSINSKNSLEPRAALKYQVSGNQSISLGFGKHSRVLPLNVYLRETRISDDLSVQTNRNLDLLRSNHYVASYDWLINENLRLKFEAYYQDLYNVGIQDVRQTSLSVLNYGADFGDVIGPDSLVSKGTGSNKGIELTLEKFFSKNYYFLLTGSLFDSKYKGSDGIERNTAFNNKYAVNILAGKEIPVGKEKQNVLILSFRQVATGGMWSTPIDLDASRASGFAVTDDSRAFQEQLPAYMRTDIRIGFRRNKKRMTEEFGLDFQNLLNRKNVFSRSFNNISGTIENNYQVGIFPMGLYRITF